MRRHGVSIQNRGVVSRRYVGRYSVAGAGELLGLAVVPGAAQAGGGQLLGGRDGE